MVATFPSLFYLMSNSRAINACAPEADRQGVVRAGCPKPLQVLRFYILEASWMIAGLFADERKVRAPQDRVVGNADRPQG